MTEVTCERIIIGQTGSLLKGQTRRKSGWLSKRATRSAESC